ncbi:MAG TPA: helix-turn-helix transcriptional regulator [Candidatus Limnocylindrales bacterium]
MATPRRSHLPREWALGSGWRDPAAQRGAEALGRAVVNARRRAGMSQRALAGRSGVDQPTISRLERGVLPGISLRRLAAIVAALPDLFR